MHGIHAQCVKYGTEPDGYINYVKGANIAGFMKVAHAMMGQELFKGKLCLVVFVFVVCAAPACEGVGQSTFYRLFFLTFASRNYKITKRCYNLN